MAFFNRKKKDEEIESQSCGCQRPNTGCRPYWCGNLCSTLFWGIQRVNKPID